jgi:hypothetical protein
MDSLFLYRLWWRTVKGSDGVSPLSTTLTIHALPLSLTPAKLWIITGLWQRQR